jgi:outer membrane protein OmpA-like peptidoglycan-associated protein
MNTQQMLVTAALFLAGTAYGQGHVAPELQTGVERAKYGDPQALFTVHFGHGSAVLTPAARALLDRAASKLGAGSIEVAGHTSGLGDETADKHLSERRAEAVRQYLIAQGVAAERLVAVGYGKAEPADTNKTEQGRAHNRRVVLRAASPQG